MQREMSKKQEDEGKKSDKEIDDGRTGQQCARHSFLLCFLLFALSEEKIDGRDDGDDDDVSAM
jgi:hypothetical protein